MSNFLPPKFRVALKDCEQFGDVLREYMHWAWEREQGNKVTQEELGAIIGLSDNVVSLWVNNKRLPPDTDTIDRICVALNCTDVQSARLMRAFACSSIIQGLRDKGFVL